MAFYIINILFIWVPNTSSLKTRRKKELNGTRMFLNIFPLICASEATEVYCILHAHSDCESDSLWLAH